MQVSFDVTQRDAKSFLSVLVNGFVSERKFGVGRFRARQKIEFEMEIRSTDKSAEVCILKSRALGEDQKRNVFARPSVRSH